MPIPFLLAAGAAVAGVTGIAKGAKSISNNNDAKNMIEDAQFNYKNAEEKLEKQRGITNSNLETLGEKKLNAWANDMNMFLKYFSLYKNVNFEHEIEFDDSFKKNINDGEFLDNIKLASMNAVEITQAGVASLGSGALAGVASYGGAMMFAHASTGTAISTLSGIAAKNATLAWFGGGAKIAGGYGMATGGMVLGGIVVGPILAVAGFIMEAKSEENLAKAKKAVAEAEKAIEQMDTMTDFMIGVQKISNQYSSFISEFSIKYMKVVNEVERVTNIAWCRQDLTRGKKRRKQDNKIDFNILTEREKRLLHLSWLMTQVYYSILTTPLLTEENLINKNANNILESANSENNLLEEKMVSIDSMRDDSFDFAMDYIDCTQYESDEEKLNALKSLNIVKNKNSSKSNVKKEKRHIFLRLINYIAKFYCILAIIAFGLYSIVSLFSMNIFTLILSIILCYVNYSIFTSKKYADNLKKETLIFVLLWIISSIGCLLVL